MELGAKLLNFRLTKIIIDSLVKPLITSAEVGIVPLNFHF